jgi:hypothetical protein
MLQSREDFSQRWAIEWRKVRQDRAASVHLYLDYSLYVLIGGRNSVVGIATRYWLDGPGFEPRWEVRFSGPIQIGPEAQVAWCTVGTGSPCRG